jgi:putative FmdB family regulatory protein
MPLYDYRCKKCGHKTYDVLISHKTPEALQRCGCGSKDWEKIPSKIAIRFKGEGFATPRVKGDEE